MDDKVLVQLPMLAPCITRSSQIWELNNNFTLEGEGEGEGCAITLVSNVIAIPSLATNIGTAPLTRYLRDKR